MTFGNPEWLASYTEAGIGTSLIEKITVNYNKRHN